MPSLNFRHNVTAKAPTTIKKVEEKKPDIVKDVIQEKHEEPSVVEEQPSALLTSSTESDVPAAAEPEVVVEDQDQPQIPELSADVIPPAAEIPPEGEESMDDLLSGLDDLLK